jgi:hypothetical protein
MWTDLLIYYALFHVLCDKTFIGARLPATFLSDAKRESKKETNELWGVYVLNWRASYVGTERLTKKYAHEFSKKV